MYTTMMRGLHSLCVCVALLVVATSQARPQADDDLQVPDSSVGPQGLILVPGEDIVAVPGGGRVFVNGPTGTSVARKLHRLQGVRHFVNGQTGTSVARAEGLDTVTYEPEPEEVRQHINGHSLIPFDNTEGRGGFAQTINGHTGGKWMPATNSDLRQDSRPPSAPGRGDRGPLTPQEDDQTLGSRKIFPLDPADDTRGMLPPELHTDSMDWLSEPVRWVYQAEEWAVVELPDSAHPTLLPVPTPPRAALVVITKDYNKKVSVEREVEGLADVRLHYRFFLSGGETPDDTPELKVYHEVEGSRQELASETQQGAWEGRELPVPDAPSSKIVFEAVLKKKTNEIALNYVVISGKSPVRKAALDADSDQMTLTRDQLNTTVGATASPTVGTGEGATQGENDRKNISIVPGEFPPVTLTENEANPTLTENETNMNAEPETPETSQDKVSADVPNSTLQGEEEEKEEDGIGPVGDGVEESTDLQDIQDSENTQELGNEQFAGEEVNGSEADFNSGGSGLDDAQPSTDMTVSAETDTQDTGAELSPTDGTAESGSVSQGSTSEIGPETNITSEIGPETSITSEIGPETNITSESANNTSSSVSSEPPTDVSQITLEVTLPPGHSTTGDTGTSASPNEASGRPGTPIGTAPGVTVTHVEQSVSSSVSGGSQGTKGVTAGATLSSSTSEDLMETSPISSRFPEITPESTPLPGTSNTNATETAVALPASSTSWQVFQVFIVLCVLGLVALGFLYWKKKRRQDDEIPVFTRNAEYHNPTFTMEDAANFMSRGGRHTYKTME